LLGLLGTVGLLALAAVLAYAWRERQEFMRLDDAAAHQLDLYAAVLETELGKQADLPALIDVDGEIDALLRKPDDAALRAAVSRKLTRFSVLSGALWTTVFDANGRAVAASDWFRPESRPDRNAATEPCVADAIGGHDALRFAPDPQRGTPEVCFARRLVRDGRTIGAVALRISLEPIEASWIDAAFRPESEKPLVVDAQGLVIVSSVPGWRLRPLEALSVPERVTHGAQLVRLRDASARTPGLHVVHERPLSRFGWRLLILSSVSDALRDARAAAWGAGAIVAAASLLMVVVLQRRRVISQKLAARAALQRAHDELEIKVQQRTAELVQAGKLALLGQLSAGISHELGQPLTALRALADNGRLLLERGRTEQVVENLRSIAGLSERMGRITAQLKAFVRKAPTTIGPVRLVDAVTDAQQLLATRLHAEQVELRVEVPPALHVLCDAYRLEQVLANLMVNAADAMRSSATKQLTIRAALTGERVVVSVVDSGPGIAPPLRERLFEPFFTTKPPGEGLGLGLVISAHIVEEFGGVLRAVDVPSGAVFEFDLAPAPQESHV
jgi:two-component system C4-dicarboxylate transport sensor histidine kinase DctB